MSDPQDRSNEPEDPQTDPDTIADLDDDPAEVSGGAACRANGATSGAVAPCAGGQTSGR